MIILDVGALLMQRRMIHHLAGWIVLWCSNSPGEQQIHSISDNEPIKVQYFLDSLAYYSVSIEFGTW